MDLDHENFSDEEIEIELAEDEPAFLVGQTERSDGAGSPVRIVKNPDGSLQRAALNQASLAKERRELRAAQREAEQEAVPDDIGMLWADPIPEGGKRYLAQDLKGIGMKQVEMPEWQKASLGGTKVSYGKKTSMSIIEQRESLPIFKLKQQLLKAIVDNQVRKCNESYCAGCRCHGILMTYGSVVYCDPTRWYAYRTFRKLESVIFPYGDSLISNLCFPRRVRCYYCWTTRMSISWVALVFG